MKKLRVMRVAMAMSAIAAVIVELGAGHKFG
jgi:hypothetical protein